MSSSTSSTEPPADWLAAGAVGKPHGLDGFVHVTRPQPALLAAAGSVRIGDDERAIAERKGSDADPLIRLEGVDSRHAAEALRGSPLLVPRTDAPALGPDEYWAEELEGCTVVDGDTVVGTVTKLLPLPSCEALEVQRDGAPTLLVPMVRDAIRTVDVAARRIDINLAFVAP